MKWLFTVRSGVLVHLWADWRWVNDDQQRTTLALPVWTRIMETRHQTTKVIWPTMGWLNRESLFMRRQLQIVWTSFCLLLQPCVHFEDRMSRPYSWIECRRALDFFRFLFSCIMTNVRRLFSPRPTWMKMHHRWIAYDSAAIAIRAATATNFLPFPRSSSQMLELKLMPNRQVASIMSLIVISFIAHSIQHPSERVQLLSTGKSRKKEKSFVTRAISIRHTCVCRLWHNGKSVLVFYDLFCCTNTNTNQHLGRLLAAMCAHRVRSSLTLRR